MMEAAAPVASAESAVPTATVITTTGESAGSTINGSAGPVEVKDTQVRLNTDVAVISRSSSLLPEGQLCG